MAWLRRLGMPPARIRVVCEPAPADAAAEVRAGRGRHRGTAEPRLLPRGTTLREGRCLRYALRTDRGPVRESNQDVGYAGERLPAVADGFGARGEPLSSMAVDEPARLDTAVPAGGPGRRGGEPDLALHDALPGGRYLLPDNVVCVVADVVPG